MPRRCATAAACRPMTSRKPRGRSWKSALRGSGGLDPTPRLAGFQEPVRANSHRTTDPRTDERVTSPLPAGIWRRKKRIPSPSEAVIRQLPHLPGCGNVPDKRESVRVGPAYAVSSVDPVHISNIRSVLQNRFSPANAPMLLFDAWLNSVSPVYKSSRRKAWAPHDLLGQKALIGSPSVQPGQSGISAERFCGSGRRRAGRARWGRE